MRKNLIVIPLCSALLFTSGCLPDNVQNDIEKAEKENQQKEETQSDLETAPEDVEISDEQKEVLDEQKEVSQEEAVQQLIEEQKSIKIDLPKAKDSFKSEQDLSQYLSNLFFLYHKGDLSADVFYERIKPHLHEEFIALLPESEADQKETFEVLQYTFMQYLAAPMESYELTSATLSSRSDEATSYRKYNTKDSDPIYYQMVMKKEGNRWLLFDDSPAPPYEIDPTITHSFKNPGGE